MYEWLKDYQELENRIKYLEYQLDKTQSELKRFEGGDLSNLRLEANSKGSLLEKNIIRLESNLKYEKEQRETLIKLVYSFNGLDQEILRKKYVEGMTLEGIAYELNYSYNYIKRRHSDLAKTINVLDEWIK